MHKQYTLGDVERLQWVMQATSIYVQKVTGITYEIALEFAEMIYDTYPDWTPLDAVEEDLSYWV